MFFWYKYSKGIHQIIYAPLDLPVLSISVKDWNDTTIINKQWGFQTTISRYIENKVNENV